MCDSLAGAMIGDHALVVVADAIHKGVLGPLSSADPLLSGEAGVAGEERTKWIEKAASEPDIVTSLFRGFQICAKPNQQS